MTPDCTFSHQRGVYIIRNNINSKCYVGRTKSFYHRCHQYIRAFNDQDTSRINSHLLNAMNKYGLDKFSFEPLEFCSEEVIYDRELYWINKIGYYNLRRDSGGHYIVHSSTKIKISERLRREWESGQRDEHSEKIVISWKNRNRKAQGELMTKNLTKYTYRINDQINVTYNTLLILGLSNVATTFCRYKTNRAFFKGCSIERLIL